MEYIVIFITASSISEAENIVNSVVTKKLAACGNIIPSVSSIFHWKGELCKEDEVLIILKSTAPNFNKVVAEVKKQHSYETPEIIALPIIDGDQDYLQWIYDETE